MQVLTIEVPVYDIVFTAPRKQQPANGPDYYEELRSVPYRMKHTLTYAIGFYQYKVVILATSSTYYGRICGVRSIHLVPLEIKLQQLYPRIDLHRFMPFQVGMRN